MENKEKELLPIGSVVLLKNGTIIDYKNSIFEQYDILIENETIQIIEKNIDLF